jgi:hypothetical protein
MNNTDSRDDKRRPINKILVVVHGMGEQNQLATSKEVAQQICKAAQHYGENHTKLEDCYKEPEVDGYAVGYRAVGSGDERLAIHEIHWANLAQDYHRPSIFRFFVGSAFNALKAQKVPLRKRLLYGAAILMTTAILWLFAKLPRVFSRFLPIIRISKLYEAFMGDVELYSRGDVDDLDHVFGGVDHVYHHVNKRFDTALERIAESFDDIYLLSHSLGTVLTLNRIISAALQKPNHQPAWLSKIKLIITMGSPIDKFAALFPNVLVPSFFPIAPPPRHPIRWYNITDYWDPVGGKLSGQSSYLFTHVPWLERRVHIEQETLIAGGTTRSKIPVLAHLSYWEYTALWKRIHDLIWDEHMRLPEVMPERPSFRILKLLPLGITCFGTLLLACGAYWAFLHTRVLFALFLLGLAICGLLAFVLELLQIRAVEGQFGEEINRARQ